MNNDLQSLPKLRDSISYLYIEHAIIEQENASIVAIQSDGRIPIPVSSVTCLMLGPGTKVTHAAMIPDHTSKGALMIFSCNNEQGYQIKMYGEPSRCMVDLDGLQLIKVQ